MFHYRDSILPHHFAKTVSTIETNKWDHFITVFNNDESEIHISVYLDGKLENSVIDSVTIYYGHTDNLRIGANKDLFAQRFFVSGHGPACRD